MYMEIILSAAMLYAIGNYIALGYESATHYIAMSRIKREPPDYSHGTINTTILPTNINFSGFGWSGLKEKKRHGNMNQSLEFPGPDLFKSNCIPATLKSSDAELCFWINSSSLLISDPYYPEEDLQCIQSNLCFVEVHFNLASRGLFLPNSGIAPTLIPRHIHSEPRLNATHISPKLSYHGGLIKHPWIRTFHWKYEGIYTLSSRPHTEFKFIYYFPALLPSGTPNAIYGMCHLDDIRDGTCSQDIFK